MVAVRENHPDVVKLLLERGARRQRQDENRRHASVGAAELSPGIRARHRHRPRRLAGARPAAADSWRDVSAAVRGARWPLEIVQPALDGGADVNQPDANGITPLITAITNNHPDVARFLIDRGADIKAVDWYGRTPLWAAVETRNMDVDNATFENSIDRAPYLDLIQLLLERGADPNVRMKEVPPIRRDFLRVTGSLAWVDFTGQTPFLTASLAGDLTVMRLLLKHGADPHIPTFAGTTALMAAAGVNWVFYQTYDEGQVALLDAVKLC